MSQNSIIVILLLVLAELFTFKAWRHDHDLYVHEKASHAVDIKTFKDAQDLANRKAEDTKNQIEHKAEQNAKAADKAYADLLTKYRANLMRYAATGRQSQANQSGGGRSNSGQAQTTEGGDGSGQGTEVLTITQDDAETCAVNTARLQAVHDWAIKQEQVDANP